MRVSANGGEIWVRDGQAAAPVVFAPVVTEQPPVVEEVFQKREKTPVVAEEVAVEEEIISKVEETPVSIPHIPYEEMTVAQLQTVILEKMAKNGPVTEWMKKTVDDNTHHGSLLTWAKSF